MTTTSIECYVIQQRPGIFRVTYSQPSAARYLCVTGTGFSTTQNGLVARVQEIIRNFAGASPPVELQNLTSIERALELRGLSAEKCYNEPPQTGEVVTSHNGAIV